MNYIKFFLLQIKRITKNKGFLLLLILFPICLFALFQSFRTEEDSRIRVGLCLNTEDTLTELLYEKLLAKNDTLFDFVEFTTEKELISGIKNNEIECGYFFKKPLLKELDKRHMKNLITVYVSEKTTCKGVLNEVVYSNLFEEYALHLLQKTLKKADDLPFDELDAEEFSLPPVTDEAIEESYRSHVLQDTFMFEVTTLSSEETEKQFQGTIGTAFPLFRGFVSLFLLLCGFLALLTVFDDQKNGLYAGFHGFTGPLCMVLTMFSHLLPAGLISLLTLKLSGCMQDVTNECSALFAYLLVMIVFYGILGSLIRNHTMLCAAFPMLLLCTLVFTPVVIDLSSYFPWLRYVRLMLPTFYYLTFF